MRIVDYTDFWKKNQVEKKSMICLARELFLRSDEEL